MCYSGERTSSYGIPPARSSAERVPPREQHLEPGQVVVGPRRLRLEQLHAEGVIGLEGSRRHGSEAAHTPASRQLDLGSVAPDLLAPAIDYRDLVHEGLRVGEAVPDVGVLGDDAQ